jgi:adhesin transport system outer membrane protein
MATAITLTDAVHLGLAAHPEVRSAMSEVNRASTDLDMSKNGYYPKVNASAGPEDGMFGDMGYDLTVSQRLYDWGRVESQVDTASAKLREQTENLLVVREDAALDICEIYLDVLTTEQRLDAVRSHISRLGKLGDLIRQRASAGYTDSGEESRANLELARAQEQLLIEKGALQDAEQQYRQLVGGPAAGLEQPGDESFSAHLRGAGDLDNAIAQSPLYRKAKQKQAVEEAKVREADASMFPQLNLEGSMLRRELGGQLTSDSVIALRIRMETIDGLSIFQRPNAARQSLEAAEWNVDTMRRDIRRKVSSLVENETTAKWREQSLREQIKHAKEVDAVYQDQFVVGLRDMTDMLTIENERFEAERQFINLQSERKRVQYRAAAQLGLLVPLLEERLPPRGTS